MADLSEFTPDQVATARGLVREAHAHGGVVPMDLPRFWADQDIAVRDPFGKDIPQVPLNIFWGGEPVFDELGQVLDLWRWDHDEPWRLALCRAYNDKAEAIIGRRILNEQPSPPPDRQYPAILGLADLFEARNEWNADSQSWWLHQSAHDEDELKALLDRVGKRDVRGFILPAGWDQARKRLVDMGLKPPLYRSQRGPVTFATSVYGVENLIYLLLENPDLAARFRDTIQAKMLELARVLDEESGYTPKTAPHGFTFADDNCYLLTPDMYEQFCFPILKAMFSRYAPEPGDWRFQHSDSPMGHLLPLLGRLDFTVLNLGPTLSVREIRQHCPRAVIHGQLAPFTFSRNDEERMVCEFLRDVEQGREHRGLLFSPAGSINNGSRLTGMRLLMAAAQRFGRYDR